MSRTSRARVARLERRARQAVESNDPSLAMVVRVDRLGPEGVALPGQIITGNVSDWIAEHRPSTVLILPDNHRGDFVQRVAGFENV